MKDFIPNSICLYVQQSDRCQTRFLPRSCGLPYLRCTLLHFVNFDRLLFVKIEQRTYAYDKTIWFSHRMKSNISRKTFQELMHTADWQLVGSIVIGRAECAVTTIDWEIKWFHQFQQYFHIEQLEKWFNYLIITIPFPFQKRISHNQRWTFENYEQVFSASI